VATRAFGGMTTKRTWFATDKVGFHILHTLFQTSLRYERIERLDEHFVTKLLVRDGRCGGVAALDIRSGETRAFWAARFCSPPAAAGAPGPSPPTAPSKPATAWRWPTAPAWR